MGSGLGLGLDHEARLAVEPRQRAPRLQRRSAPRRSLEHQQTHIGLEGVLTHKVAGEDAHAAWCKRVLGG